MGWSSPRTWVFAETVTVAHMNTEVRDDLSALWAYAANGDMLYRSGAAALSPLSIGTAKQVLRVNAAANAPEWEGAPHAYVFRNAIQTIANATTTALIFDSETHDTNNFWDVGSPTIFTIPYTGVYVVSGAVSFDTNAVGARILRIRKNAGNFVSDTKVSVTGTSTDNSVSVVHKFAATDTIDLVVWQNSGGNLNTGATASRMMIVFIGA